MSDFKEGPIKMANSAMPRNSEGSGKRPPPPPAAAPSEDVLSGIKRMFDELSEKFEKNCKAPEYKLEIFIATNADMKNFDKVFEKIKDFKGGR